MNLRTAKIVSVILTLTGVSVLLIGQSFAWPGNHQGYEPIQPIAFSHKIHAGLNQISCLYCHSSADKSKVAGIPPASTCMNCHSQIKKDSPEVQKIATAIAENKPIEWVKVHDLPDHATFNHSRHVTSNISCQTCHGPVETMDRVVQTNSLLMGTCVSCHREYRDVTLDPTGRPVISSDPSHKKLKASTDCSVCHQ